MNYSISRKIVIPLTVVVSIALCTQANSIERVNEDNLNIESSHRPRAAEQARDRQWNRTYRDNGTRLGCTGLDLKIQSVKITRYPDRGTIGIYAKVKNICRGSTGDPVRVVFEGWDGAPMHAWIRGGIGRGQTKGIGLVTDDNAQGNRAKGPVRVKVNHLKEITERNYSNNVCANSRLAAGENLSVNHCL